jgi:hypothetical protein
MQPAILVQTVETAPFLLVRKAIDHPEQGQLTVAAILSLEPFSRALADQADPNWTVAVLDPNRLIAGRSRDPDNFVGRPATPSLVEEIGAANESFFYALNQEGQRVYTAFSRSAGRAGRRRSGHPPTWWRGRSGGRSGRGSGVASPLLPWQPCWQCY